MRIVVFNGFLDQVVLAHQSEEILSPTVPKKGSIGFEQNRRRFVLPALGIFYECALSVLEQTGKERSATSPGGTLRIGRAEGTKEGGRDAVGGHGLERIGVGEAVEKDMKKGRIAARLRADDELGRDYGTVFPQFRANFARFHTSARVRFRPPASNDLRKFLFLGVG
jgi:hypothetical protein